MSSRRSRMSLGGGALRRGVLDGSSRYNVRSAATSDDEYQTTPQKSYPSGSSSSVSRRESFGGEGILSRSNYAAGSSSNGIATINSGVVNRRAMLQKWRQHRNGGAATTVDDNNENASIETRKRNRGDPLLPPVSKQHRSTTASTNHSYYSHHSQENNYGGSVYDNSDDEMESRGYGGSVLSGRTPSSNRRMTIGSARRKTPLLGRSVIQSNREGKTNV